MVIFLPKLPYIHRIYVYMYGSGQPYYYSILCTQVEACQQLLPLQGAIEHVRAGAPLPHAHVAASTMYTVEYVDLGQPISS